MNNLAKITFTYALVFLTTTALAEDHKMHQGMTDMFAKCDTNGDGMIFKDEFLAEKTRMFEKHDLNHDGKISKDEHEKMVADMKQMMSGDHAMKMETK